MHPLKNWTQYKIGYRYGVKTTYNPAHLGIDIWCTVGTPLYAPFNGTVKYVKGSFALGGGGHMAYFYPDGKQEVIRLLHLKEKPKEGHFLEGQQFGLTGTSVVPHLHLDIAKNKNFNVNKITDFINPETYNWNPMFTTQFKVLSNVRWNSLPGMLIHAQGLLKEWTNQRVNATFNVSETSFTNVPIVPWGNMSTVDVDWYRQNITPLAKGYDHSILILPKEQWPGLDSGFMSWSDEKQPVRIQVAGHENEDLGGIQTVTKRILHEIAHDFGWITGREDYVDGVHNFDYNQNNLAGYFQTINYDLLEQRLKERRTQMNQAKIVKSKNSSTVYICYPVPSETHSNERASLEGIAVPNLIPNTDTL